MKKLFIIVGGIVSLCLVVVIAAYATLHTQYAPKMLNTLIRYGLNQNIHIESVTYSYKQPKLIRFQQVAFLQEDQEPILIEDIALRLGSRLWKNNQLQIDNLLIDGMKLDNTASPLSLSNNINIHQLAIANLDIIDRNWRIRDLNMEITAPKPAPNAVLPFYEEIRLSAEQVYWHGEAINHLFIVGSNTAEATQIDALRFSWRGGQFQGQAKQLATNNKWVMPKLMISNLRLQHNDNTSIDANFWQSIQSTPIEIQDLDVKQSSFETPLVSINNANIQAQQIQLPFSLWQQQDTQVRISADYLSLYGTPIPSPLIDLHLQKNKIQMKNLSLNLLEGSVLLQGEATPDTLSIKNLNMNTIRWIATEDTKQLFVNYANRLKEITLENVTINRVHVIDLTSTPAKQASGLNIDGKDLHIKQQGQWGLWNGKASISASQASYDGINSQNMLVDMHTTNGHFWLDQVFIPLDSGLIKGTADIEFIKNSQPWKLDLDVTGLPLRFFTTWFPMPLEIDGITDIKVKGSGLYGDMLIFKHSVTGEIKARITQASTDENIDSLWEKIRAFTSKQKKQTEADEPTTLVVNTEDNEEDQTSPNPNQEQQSLFIEDIRLTSDRGRVSLTPFNIEAKDFTAHFGGKYDFLYPEQSKIQYQIKGECQSFTLNLLDANDVIEKETHCSD